MSSIIKKITETLNFVEKHELYPDISRVDGVPTEPEITIGGQKVVAFCSNNYLGLAHDERVKKAVKENIEIYGMGSGGSRLVSGNTILQEELEKSIASFKNRESAITFATGYMANTGTIPALFKTPQTSILKYLKNMLGKEDRNVIFSDELNHASIIDGVNLSKAERVIYKHKDLNYLESELKKYKSYSHKLIVSDGVFSMDGDITPLPEILDLAEQYDVTVMIDDAHATGVLGENGRGTVEYFNLKKYPEILMGTFTKVFGGLGGFIVGSEKLTKYLRVTANTYVFSAPIPPSIVAGLIKAIEIVQQEPERRRKLWDNVHYLRNKLNSENFRTLNSQTQILPIFIGDETKGIKVSRELLKLGFFVPCVRWPAVKHGESRLRLTLMSTHTKEQIDKFFEALCEVRKKVNF